MPFAIVYAGPGVSQAADDTVECMEAVARLAGFQVRRFVNHPWGEPRLVEKTANGFGDELDLEILRAASLWLTPGSDVGHSWYKNRGHRNNYAIYALLKDAGYDKMLISEIKNGLGYVGICAGAYLAANGDSLDLLNTNKIWAWNAGEHAISASIAGPDGEASIYHMTLLYGPVFDAIPGVEVVGQYQGPQPPQGSHAMVTFSVGKGRVFLSGPHPEAPNDPGWDPHGQSAWRAPASLARNHQLLSAWMKAAARL